MHQDNRSPREDQTPDELDRALEIALGNYSTVEPRAGLEERVLKKLSEQPQARRADSWLRWGFVAATVAGAMFVALTLRPEKLEHPHIAAHTVEARTAVRPPNQMTSSDRSVVRGFRTQKTIHHLPDHARAVIAEANPRLDQFPSPEPLSDQEKILARYVTKYPEHAALVAEARTQELHCNEEEMTESKLGSQTSGEQSK
jgi:hypothetical protein